jgi:type IX secretion system PorP/SprF family membrane protein
LKLKAYILLLFLIVFFKANAQEIILSQPYTAAQFLTPASVGNGLYDQRIQSNFRSQSIGGFNIAKTIVVGWDRKYNRSNEEGSNYLGIGGQIISEQLMNGLLNTNHITVNSAYHLFLDGDDYSNLALGLGITYSQATLDLSKLRFGDMFNLLGNLSGNPTAEIFLSNPSRFSANTGFLFTRHSNDTYLQLSANGFFFAKPDITNSPYNESPGMRSTLFMNLEKYFNEDYTYLIHGAFSSRNNVNSYVAGASISLPIKYQFDHDRRLYLGCFYRLKDAIIPSVNIMMDNYIFGISYDIYNNDLTSAGIRSNSFELTFSKSFGKRKQDLMRTLFD